MKHSNLFYKATHVVSFVFIAMGMLFGGMQTSFAQSDYPNKAIRFVIPFPAGQMI
jgi:tripartite-type tricarboxylate transporter receptor subunit TctC